MSESRARRVMRIGGRPVAGDEDVLVVVVRPKSIT